MASAGKHVTFVETAGKSHELIDDGFEFCHEWTRRQHFTSDWLTQENFLETIFKLSKR